ncbi:sugar phosphate isomerase/epimerase family protein [Brevibacillus marinus]|uniref:sugar phosphate isomerase/epimerase family protein n=1 Tax=Brevibacillus marinus TaxID=2496837 RepID=UPI000F843B7B|nr:sugar phosphate isomerase/epimerase [Brevibacillus marinus]
MKIAFNQATTLKQSTLALDLVYCEKYGYDYIEIRLDKLRQYLSFHAVEDLRAFFAAHLIKPYAFNALEFVTFRDQADYRQICEDLHFLCEVGGSIHCNTLIVVPTFDVGERTRGEIKRETVRVLRDLAERAAPYGMRLALEFCGYPTCSVNTFAQAYEIVSEVDREDVGIVLDCFHFHAMNSHLEDLRRADPRKIFGFHLDDCEDLPVGALRDHHRVWPGEGAINLELILSALLEIGYREMVSIELFRPEYWEWDAERAIRVGKETTERIISRYFPVG